MAEQAAKLSVDLEFLARETAKLGYETSGWSWYEDEDCALTVLHVAVTLHCPCGREEELLLAQAHTVEFASLAYATSVVNDKFLRMCGLEFAKHLREFYEEEKMLRKNEGTIGIPATVTSLKTMILRLDGMLDTNKLTAWEEKFVKDMVGWSRHGNVLSSLTDNERLKIEELYGKHFA